ncbi:MAG: glycoside hydrolase family 48 protein [Bacillota bacterium]|nr:glycoside hydrolase family 48 protein [Bacillota bacterium]
MLKKKRKHVSLALCSFMFVSTLGTANLGSSSTTAAAYGAYSYKDAFLDLHQKVDDPSTGYFSPDGLPYHSIETMIVEGPDYGHESSSETMSYYVWFEAMYGNLTGDWAPYNKAWDAIEKYYIPSDRDQPNLSGYDPNRCSSFIPGGSLPDDYPQQLNLNAPTGKDGIYAQLKAAYGKDSMYLMHWLMDIDNWYKYGNHGDGTSRISQINTYQRGEQESCWETAPFPCWETFKWGSPTKGGFGSLFVSQDAYSKQWRYSVASDADARAVQAAYEANKFAKAQGKQSEIGYQNERAARLGDYLRYCMYDKYMKPIGYASQNGPAGDGINSLHYLISWSLAWGGPVVNEGWAWKNGGSASHQGYQNPLAAYALSNTSELKPKSSGGASDWGKSLTRQLEFLQWLQSSEGALAGGCTNSFDDRYDTYPAGISTFYGMAYDWRPVLHDPPSNRWFGYQAWSVQRLAEYYYETGDEKAYKILKKWVAWVLPNITINGSGDFLIPSDISWVGQPDTWNGTYTGNPNLHAAIDNYGSDIGIAASTANLLFYYAAGTKKYANFDQQAHDIARRLLDCIILGCQDSKGYTKEEQRGDYSRFFDQEVYIPAGWTGSNGQGAQLKTGMKFIDMRPAYKQDPDWDNLINSYRAGIGPKFSYHRYSQQVDIGMALGAYVTLFTGEIPPPPPIPDVNGDHIINMADVLKLAASFGKRIGDLEYSPILDLNSDGVINMADLVYIAKHFGETC